MRRRPPDRVQQIVDASLRVFGEKGYRRTQMADVARAMGVSPGTLYNYVAGKEALFYLMIDRACLDESAADTLKFPLPAPSPGAIIQRLRERLRADVKLPTLETALARSTGGDVRLELARIVGELYTLIDRRWPAIVALERSAPDLPELARVFYVEMRRGLFGRLQQYLTTRIAQRRLRPLPHIPGASRLILEAVADFAMHRHGDPDPVRIDDSAAREAVIDFVVHALLPVDRQPTRRPKEQSG
ncbi:MAG TPA: helix-turn-helix domain-containing protein [Methylomirabilota bacterium]|nr:helix-turn-helix domain-containing protein [Methylomirabilota bacterium]